MVAARIIAILELPGRKIAAARRRKLQGKLQVE
jgi:hypothetical protein